MRLNIPLALTLGRVAAIPVVLALFYVEWPHARQWACVLFVLAAITDWLDGYLARRLNQTSPFGAFLDPVADKLLVVMALVLLAANFTSPWFVVPTAVIIAREVFVSALREWMANCNQRNLVAVGYIGKVKTTVQMIAITILIGVDVQSPQILVQLGYALIYLSAVFSMWSMITYLRAALPTLKMK